EGRGGLMLRDARACKFACAGRRWQARTPQHEAGRGLRWFALRTLCAAALCAAALALSCAAVKAQAQHWPDRPVKIIAPFAAGGAADTLGRVIAEHLSNAFQQQFYIENRGGAGGAVGTAAGAAAEPDGYTLVISSIAGLVISPAFNVNVGYDGLADFSHIAYLGGPPSVTLVHPSLGVRPYPQFVALAPAASQPI